MNFVNFVNKCRLSIFFRKSCEKETVRTIGRQEALSRPSPQGGFFSFLLAALYARQKPLYPRRVYRHERDGGDHRFSRYSESSENGEATNRTEIISPANEQYENRSRLLRYHYKQEPLRMQRSSEATKRNTSGSMNTAKRQKQRSGEAEYKWPMLPPAAYLERELRRIVCWLLILSAEI